MSEKMLNKEKMFDRTKIIILCCYYAVFVAMLLVLALVKDVGSGKVYLDLFIDQKLYNPNVLVEILERMGHSPTYLVPAAACAFLFPVLIKKEKTILKVLGYLCIPVVYAAMLMAGHDLFKHLVDGTWDTILGWVLPALLAVGSTFCSLYFISKKCSKEFLDKMAIWCIYALICVLASTVIVYILKYSWGRCRFRYMYNYLDKDFSQFTPWYQANGFFKGENYYSFPSGHTYSAAMVFTLPAIFMLFKKQKDQYWPVMVFCICYTVLVALSRIVIGAHYLSDVLMGGTIGFTVCMVAKYLYFYKYNMKRFADSVSAEGQAINIDDNTDPTDVTVNAQVDKEIDDSTKD